MWQAEQNSGVLVKVLDNGLRVAVEMGEDFGVGHDAGDAIALFVHHHRWHAHDETAVTQLGLHALDGVAGGAGEAVAVEGAVESPAVFSAPPRTPIGL